MREKMKLRGHFFPFFQKSPPSPSFLRIDALKKKKKSMAEASSYLRSFVESTAELPAEVQRTFLLMRELDEKSAALQESADAAARALLLGEPLPPRGASSSAALQALSASTNTAPKRSKPTEQAMAELRERMEADMKQVKGLKKKGVDGLKV
jgi:Inhibitor of growth proteins N-terminal histone-binding